MLDVLSISFLKIFLGWENNPVIASISDKYRKSIFKKKLNTTFY